MSGRRLILGSSLALAIKIANAGLQFLLQIMLARMLGVTDFGVYMFALAWVNVLLIGGKMGFDTSALRFIATYKAESSWNYMYGFIRSTTNIVFFSSVSIGLLFFLSTFVWGEYLSYSQHQTLVLAMLLVPILSLLQVKGAVLRGLGSIFKSLAPFSIVRQLILIGFLATCYFCSYKLSAYKAQELTIVSAFFALLLSIYWVNNETSTILKKKRPVPAYALKTWIKTALPMMAISGFQIVISQSDIIMVNMLLGSDEGGVYAAMSQLSLLVSMGLVSINTVMAPTIARLYAQNNDEELQSIVTLSAKLSFGVTLLACLLLFIFGKSIAGFYGREFIAGYPVLLILMLSQATNASAGTVGYIMTMTGHQNFSATVMGLCAGINIILNLALIPIYGTLGAATATTFATILWVIVLATYSRRLLNISSTAFGI